MVSPGFMVLISVKYIVFPFRSMPDSSGLFVWTNLSTSTPGGKSK